MATLSGPLSGQPEDSCHSSWNAHIIRSRRQEGEKLSIHIGVLMDPIESINPKKDSTLAMMLAAQARGWTVSVFTQAGLIVENGAVRINHRVVKLQDDLEQWFEVIEAAVSDASDFDAILMRKDPPFDMEYVYSTYLLEIIEDSGTPVLNRPGSIRDCNEKLCIALPTMYTSPPRQPRSCRAAELS